MKRQIKKALILMMILSILGGCGSNSYRNTGTTKSSSENSTGTGAGGYDMPQEGESFSDYVKRVDPGLYDDMERIYNEATK